VRTGNDYSSEIMGLIVLAALSAVNHFWYILIALCAAITAAGAGFLISRVVLYARRDILARMMTTPDYNARSLESKVSAVQSAQSSPVA